MAAMHILLGPLLLAAAAAQLRSPADETALLQARLSPGVQEPDERLKLLMETVRTQLRDSTAPQSVSNAVQPLVNFANSQYVSYVTLGKQVLAGIVDTGSYELVVFGSKCATCGVAAHYSNMISNSYEGGTLETEHNYGSGYTYCNEGFEQVAMGPYPPKKQMFWEVQEAEMPCLEGAAYEAIIGLGPFEVPLMRAWDEADALVKNLTSYYDQAMMAPPEAITEAEQKVKVAIKLGSEMPMLHTWSIPRFSICMGTRGGSDGVLVWNDTTPFDKPSIFKEVPIMGDSHRWSASMTKPKLKYADGRKGLHLGCEDGCEALLDSGTSLLGVPKEAAEMIVKAIDDLNANCSNLEVLPHLKFRLGGEKFSLPPSAYMAKVGGDWKKSQAPMLHTTKQLPTPKRQCEVLIFETSDFTEGGGGMWILGVPFFRKYYTTFELGRTMEDRKFYIAEHSREECVPIDGDKVTKAYVEPEQLLEVKADKLNLPGLSRGTSRTRNLQRK